MFLVKKLLLNKPYQYVSRCFSTLGLVGLENRKLMKQFEYNHEIPSSAMISKLTHLPILSDNHKRYHNYLRISLTEQCNFRCQYCSVSTQVDFTPKDQLCNEDHFLRMIHAFIQAGVTKIRLTGGEPTIYKGLSKLIYEIGQKEEVKTLAMTTNGYILHKKINEYAKNGLNAINISLDTFNEERFQTISRIKGLKHVLKSIDKALELGIKVKINCVVMKGVNDDEICDFIEFVRDKNINVRFIEFFAIGDNLWNSNKMVSFKDMKEIIESKYGPLIRKNDHYTETAKNFTLEGFKGNISFITSATKPFCGGCNRIRLLSTGEFRRCLHDDNMLNIRKIIDLGYKDDVLLEAISQHLKGKHKAHAGMEWIAENMKNGVQMIKIGG